MPLSMGRTNQELIISDVVANSELRQKLLDMGFTKGCKLQVVEQMNKGTIVVKLRGSKIVLNAATAHKIHCN